MGGNNCRLKFCHICKFVEFAWLEYNCSICIMKHLRFVCEQKQFLCKFLEGFCGFAFNFLKESRFYLKFSKNKQRWEVFAGVERFVFYALFSQLYDRTITFKKLLSSSFFCLQITRTSIPSPTCNSLLLTSIKHNLFKNS